MKSILLLTCFALAVPAAFAAPTPQPLWSFSTGGPIRSTILAHGDQLYVTSGDGFAYALDRSGKLLWKTKLKGGASYSTPAWGAEGLAVVSGGSTLELLDPRDGKPLWSLSTGADVTYDEWDYHHSSPLFLSDSIVFGSGDGFLYAVSPQGRTLWKAATQPGDDPSHVSPAHSFPVIADGLLYFASAWGDVFQIDPRSGGKKEVRRLGDRIDGVPLIDHGQLFVGSRNTQFFALDTTMKPQWSYRSLGGSWMTSSAAIWNGMVVAGSSDDKAVYAWDRKTGAIVWRAAVEGNAFSQVVITPAGALITTGDAREAGHGHLWSISSEGRVQWEIALPGNSWATPLYDKNQIIVGDDSGVLHVFR